MKHDHRFKRIIHSVFTKLLAVIVLAGFCISLLIAGFFITYRHLAGEMFEENMVIYADYLIKDIGNPPNFDRAREISDKTGLAIRYEGSESHWSTGDHSDPIDTTQMHAWHEGQGFKAGMFHGRYFMIVERGVGRFTFEMTGRFADERPVKRLPIIFFALLTLLLLMAYFTIRRILKPVRWLQDGVQHVGSGNLDHRVPLARTGEFRDLAASFNAMAERVKEMMRAKEHLLLDVSHELRSPITRMKVAIEFMEEGKVKESIREDIVEMERMVSEILDTYRRFKEPGVLNLKKVNLAELIDDVVSSFDGQPPGVELKTRTDTVLLNLDPEKIKTVMRNIIANGLKYSDDDAEPVIVYLQRQNDLAVVEVLDHGIGIQADALPYVFEPFYRVDASRSRKTGGYGLGLSLCKAIIEAHGGRIELHSEIEKGTAIRFFLPMS